MATFIVNVLLIIIVCTFSQDYNKEEGGVPTVGLSVIAKNEAHVITRMLNSVKPIVDYVTIVDTGSTDNTVEVVKNWLRENGLPGQVLFHEFVTFEDARNFALEAGREKTTFGFWIDCDEYVVYDDLETFNPTTFKTNLGRVDKARVEIILHKQHSSRSQFFRNSLPFRWNGPIHEILECDAPNRIGDIKGFHVETPNDGGSWKAEDPREKNRKRALVLEEYVKDPANWKPRWLFYLGQTYRAAEIHEKSFEWYKIRAAENEGFLEEQYVSQLMVGYYKKKFDYPFPEILHEYMKCSEIDTIRGEHFKSIIQMYKSVEEFEIAYIFAKHAYDHFHEKNPFPDRFVIVQAELYDWIFLAEYSEIAAITRRVNEAHCAFEKLIPLIEARGEEILMKDYTTIYRNAITFYQNNVVPKDIVC